MLEASIRSIRAPRRPINGLTCCEGGPHMKATVVVSIVIVVGLVVFARAQSPAERPRAGEPYDYRTTPEYERLSPAQQRDLAQVRRDFAMLWGALDMYADAHGGRPPASLADLVPLYLPELPRDPFASEQTAQERDVAPYQPSVDGWGYRYRPGGEGNRAWCISSVGLPGFPFLARRGNVDLYVCKGEWISGINPVLERPRRGE